MPYKIYADGAILKQGVFDKSGILHIMHSPLVQRYKIELANGVIYDMPMVDQYANIEQGSAASEGYLKHVPGAPAPDTGDAPSIETLRKAYRKLFK